MIQQATMSDAPLMVALMHDAFNEYRHTAYSSSALEETVDTVVTGFHDGAQSLILYNENNEAVAMVRYKLEHNALYFFRLAVKSTAQGKGYSKKLLVALEEIAISNKLAYLTCEVRSNVPRNVLLYTKLGYIEMEAKVVTKTTEGDIKLMTMVKKLLDA